MTKLQEDYSGNIKTPNVNLVRYYFNMPKQKFDIIKLKKVKQKLVTDLTI